MARKPKKLTKEQKQLQQETINILRKQEEEFESSIEDRKMDLERTRQTIEMLLKEQASNQ